MQKILFIALFLSILNICKAQVIVKDFSKGIETNISDLTELDYIEVFGEPFTVIDFGKGKGAIKNIKTDKPKFFLSRVELFNFLSANGWEYVDSILDVKGKVSTSAWTKDVEGQTNSVNTYIFKRKKS
jgi:hypothetical protein